MASREWRPIGAPTNDQSLTCLYCCFIDEEKLSVRRVTFVEILHYKAFHGVIISVHSMPQMGFNSRILDMFQENLWFRRSLSAVSWKHQNFIQAYQLKFYLSEYLASNKSYNYSGTMAYPAKNCKEFRKGANKSKISGTCNC